MTITIRPRWSLGRGKTLVPSRWQATADGVRLADARRAVLARVNAKSRAQALAHFTPSARYMADWMNEDTSTWATFSDVACRPVTSSATDATVRCTFHEFDVPSAGNPDSWWCVMLHRASDGRWLITNYGQP